MIKGLKIFLGLMVACLLAHCGGADSNRLNLGSQTLTFNADSFNGPAGLFMQPPGMGRPPLPNNLDSFFQFSTEWAAFYPHVSSIDFDLGLTFLDNTFDHLDCRVILSDFNPPTVSVSNPDGFSGSDAFIEFGLFKRRMVNALKTRRVEMDTAGALSFTFQVTLSCQYNITSNGKLIITNILPSLGSEGDSIIINGIRLGNNPTVTLGGQSVSLQSSSQTQIIATVPIGASTGPLVVTRGGGGSTNSDQFNFYRVDATLEETIDGSLAAGPTTGLLVTALYPVGSIDAQGCPTQPEVYSLFTFNFDANSANAFNESERLPPGTWDSLIWIDPTSSGNLNPQVGFSRVSNFNNTVQISANNRSFINHNLVDTYTANCP